MAFENEDIETVVTKEQFESISYKVTNWFEKCDKTYKKSLEKCERRD